MENYFKMIILENDDEQGDLGLRECSMMSLRIEDDRWEYSTDAK